MKKINIFILILFATFLVNINPAKAFIITPSKYVISLAPGDSQDLLVSVTNNSTQAHDYKPVIMGIEQDGQGRPIFKKNIDVAENWIELNNSQTNLFPNAKQDFIYRVSVPANTSPSAHYVGLGVEEVSGHGISASLMNILNLQVAGVANESLIVENFSPVNSIFFNKDWRYVLSVKNSGNIDIPMSGTLDISVYGKNIYSQSLVLGNRLFAQSNRNANIKVSSVQKFLWPGKYSASVILHYGLTNQVVKNTLNFWYLPLWLIFTIVIVFTIVGIFLIKKNFKNAKKIE